MLRVRQAPARQEGYQINGRHQVGVRTTARLAKRMRTIASHSQVTKLVDRSFAHTKTKQLKQISHQYHIIMELIHARVSIVMTTGYLSSDGFDFCSYICYTSTASERWLKFHTSLSWTVIRSWQGAEIELMSRTLLVLR